MLKGGGRRQTGAGPRVFSAQRLLLLWLLCAAIATMAPFNFTADIDRAARVRDAFRLLGDEQDPQHVVLNVLLFVPLGVLLGHDRRRRQWKLWRSVLRTGLAGLAISCCFEAAQVFLVDRVPSIIDVGANVFGTIAGFSGRALLDRQRERARTIPSTPTPCIGNGETS